MELEIQSITAFCSSAVSAQLACPWGTNSFEGLSHTGATFSNFIAATIWASMTTKKNPHKDQNYQSVCLSNSSFL